MLSMRSAEVLQSCQCQKTSLSHAQKQHCRSLHPITQVKAVAGDRSPPSSSSSSSQCSRSSDSVSAAFQLSRRSGLAIALASSASLVLGALGYAPAAFADDADNGRLDKIIDDYAANETNFATDPKALASYRERFGFARLNDGRVVVKSSKGLSYTVRLDMGAPGTMLLRETKGGSIFALTVDGVVQVDLSEDYTVLALFSDGEWEKQMTGVTFADKGGKTKQLTMPDPQFRMITGFGEDMKAE